MAISQIDILLAEANSLQLAATAAQGVADATLVESNASPKDENLQLAAMMAQEDATRDQAAATAAMDAYNAALAAIPVEQPIVDGTLSELTKEATPVVVKTATPKVVVPVAMPVVGKDTKTTAVSFDFEGIISKIKASGTLAERTFVVQIEQYITAMQPGKPMTSEVGARNQIALWRTIFNCIERTEEEFHKIYSLLLAYFEQYKDGVFHERYVFRFAEMMTLPPEELATYQRTINLIKITCSPLGRNQSLKQVDLSRTLKDVFSEPGRQKLLTFYGK